MEISHKIVEQTGGGKEVELQIINKLKELGVMDKLVQLDPERQNIMAGAIGGLWKINSLGQSVENEDREKVMNAKIEREPDRTRVRETVGDGLGQIGYSFHGAWEWFDTSIINIVEASVEKDQRRHENLKQGAVDKVWRYITNLDKAGLEYGRLSTQLSWAKNAGEVENYLKEVRPSNIREMKGLLEGVVAFQVKHLKPMVDSES